MVTFTVTNLNNEGDGSLRQAISNANALEGADIIEFDSTLSGGTIALSGGMTALTGALSIFDSVSINGLGASLLSVSGSNLSRIFTINDDIPYNYQSSDILEVVISGLTLTNGNATGGAIFNADENLTLIDTVITGNTAAGASTYYYRPIDPKGGGIYNNSGTVTIIDSVISGNTAAGGSTYNSSVVVDAKGGGIYNNSGTVTMINSVISGNTVEGGIYISYFGPRVGDVRTGGQGSGAGIYNRAGLVEVTNSIITGNTALGGYGNIGGSATGGGITSTNNGTLTVNNSIISNNAVLGRNTSGFYSSAYGSGGGISGSNITINNSTLSGNTAIGGNGSDGTPSYRALSSPGQQGASGVGGGISGSNITINNSTLSGNTAIGGNGGNGTDGSYFYYGYFKDGAAGGKGGLGSGGAVAGSNVTISNSTLSGNTARGGQGGSGGSGANSQLIGYGYYAFYTPPGDGGNGGDGGDGIGGGISVSNNLTITNSTITNNTAAGNSGGFGRIGGTGLGGYSNGSNGSGGSIGNASGGGVSANGTVTSTIIAGNTNNLDIAGVFRSRGNNLIGNGDGGSGFINGVKDDLVGTTTNPIDPLLSPLQDNGGPTLTHIPLPGSPAIDAGSNPNNLVTDQRGAPRVVRSPDIGAVEVPASTKIGNAGNNALTGGKTSDFLDGLGGNDALNGGDGNDLLRGGAGRDRLTGSRGNDIIIGGADRDILLGGSDADVFRFSSLSDSLVAASDRIRDFNQTEGDRFSLLPINPSALFNAGVVVASNLTQAVQAAYNDKNQAQPGQTLGVNEGVLFTLRKRTYLSINDNVMGFNPNSDLVVEVSGIILAAGDENAGLLTLSNYFI